MIEPTEPSELLTLEDLERLILETGNLCLAVIHYSPRLDGFRFEPFSPLRCLHPRVLSLTRSETFHDRSAHYGLETVKNQNPWANTGVVHLDYALSSQLPGTP